MVSPRPCPRCSTPNAAAARFCSSCGLALTAAPAEAPEPTYEPYRPAPIGRLILAAPFMIAAFLAFGILGLQFILFVLNVLGGSPFLDAAGRWLLNTVILAIVGTVAGSIGARIAGYD